MGHNWLRSTFTLEHYNGLAQESFLAEGDSLQRNEVSIIDGIFQLAL